jgi:hypothetical protein
MSIIIILMLWVQKPAGRRNDLSVGISIEVIIFSLTHYIWTGIKVIVCYFCRQLQDRVYEAA